MAFNVSAQQLCTQLAELSFHTGIHALVVELEDESTKNLFVHIEVELYGTLHRLSNHGAQVLLSGLVQRYSRGELSYIDFLLAPVKTDEGSKDKEQVALATLLEEQSDEAFAHGMEGSARSCTQQIDLGRAVEHWIEHGTLQLLHLHQCAAKGKRLLIYLCLGLALDSVGKQRFGVSFGYGSYVHFFNYVF